MECRQLIGNSFEIKNKSLYVYILLNIGIILLNRGGKMAKAGMRRPDPSEPHGTESNKKMKIPKNESQPVPEIQGEAKKGHKKANPT